MDKIDIEVLKLLQKTTAVNPKPVRKPFTLKRKKSLRKIMKQVAATRDPIQNEAIQPPKRQTKCGVKYSRKNDAFYQRMVIPTVYRGFNTTSSQIFS